MIIGSVACGERYADEQSTFAPDGGSEAVSVGAPAYPDLGIRVAEWTATDTATAYVPTATPYVAPTQQPRDPTGGPHPVPQGAIAGIATSYGESYQGRPLGCGTGVYDTNDASIAAVGPARYGEWPCGQRLLVCGARSCIHVTRQDSCPGCGANHLDLSEEGVWEACGIVATCGITITPE